MFMPFLLHGPLAGHHCLLFNQATGTVHVRLFGILSTLIVLFRRYIPVILDFDVVVFFMWPFVKALACLMSAYNGIRIKASYLQLMVPYVGSLCLYYLLASLLLIFGCFIHVQLPVHFHPLLFEKSDLAIELLCNK